MNLDAAWELVRERGAAAQLYVSVGGKTLLHRGMRCARDSLFWTFSASKPVISVLTYRLAAQGLIDLDSPVARYWPEFARAGKGDITVRAVLRHRTGMPLAGSATLDALAMPNWRLETTRIARSRPRLEPEAGPAYQWVIYGYILGEVARLVTGRALPALLHSEVLGPLGMDATFLGVPPAIGSRSVPLRGVSLGERAAAPFLNSGRVRQAVIPSAGISTTAASLARLYESLLGFGRPVMSAEALAEATTPTWQAQIDQFLREPCKWGQGFQLGGSLAAARPASSTTSTTPSVRPSLDPSVRWISPFGARSSERTFGHNGSNCCIAWADPDRDLVFVYLTDRWSFDARGHLTQVADAVLAALDATRQRP